MKFNKHERFSIRKFKVGAASVLLGAFGIILASNAVDIQDINVVKVAKATDNILVRDEFTKTKEQVISNLLKSLENKWEEVEKYEDVRTVEESIRIYDIKVKLEGAINNIINKATDLDQLNSLKSQYESVILSLNDLGKPVVKHEAIESINAAYILKIKKFDSDQYYIAKLDKLKEEAIKSINDSKNNESVETKKNEYLEKINSFRRLDESEKILEDKKQNIINKLLSDLDIVWKNVEANRNMYTDEEFYKYTDNKELLEESINRIISETADDLNLELQKRNLDSIISNFLDANAKPLKKPNAINQIQNIYSEKKKELEGDDYSVRDLELLKKKAIEAIKSEPSNLLVENTKNDFHEKIMLLQKSHKYYSQKNIEIEIDKKRVEINNFKSITTNDKNKSLEGLTMILEDFKLKLRDLKNDINSIKELEDETVSLVQKYSLRLNLNLMLKPLLENMKNPESFSDFEIESKGLANIRADLKYLYKTQLRILDDGTNFAPLDHLVKNDNNNKAIMKFVENYVYESIGETIINEIKANIDGGLDSEKIKKMVENIEKTNKNYISILEKEYGNFGIVKFRVDEDKIESIVYLLSKQIENWKVLIPKLDNLNEKVKENNNLAINDAENEVKIEKESPKNTEISQPEVLTPGETAPIKPAPEKTPVPEKEIPKKPEMAPVPPKVGIPESGDNKKPEVSTPGETVPNKPTPETTPVPEKEAPKPGQPEMIPAPPKMETPEVEDNKQPEASKPEKDNSKDSNPETSKPEETVPSKPAPEVTPKAPEKATPKELEMGQPKPGKPEVSKPEKDNSKENNPESSKPGETKPKENTPIKPEVSNPEVSQPDVNKPGETKPKEQGLTSAKQELTKQVGDSVVTVIMEDSRKVDLQAKDVTAENKEFIQSKLNDKSATIKVFDLELLDFDNKSVIKSDKERTVKIVVTENIANKEVSVYYVDKATGQLVKVPAIVNGNTIVFNTDHFSSYGLVISDKEKSKTTSTAKISNKKLPNTGETTNNILGILGLAATVVISTRRKSLKK